MVKLLFIVESQLLNVEENKSQKNHYLATMIIKLTETRSSIDD